ncbi:polysaccharide deacetylase family protein [Butyrivibrio sp. AE2032]|uniref:polysaccharide deacetylase family protein n=1 Tax=Butyrivibrio sp. AE2032 TaxID=1458463 RepID=UPI000AFD36C6|nr:polysaccharide deacetylase family protein [Butyrivibrio sp. AE2032]
MAEKRKMRNIYIAFPEGKHKVLTLSYDDGKMPDKRLLDILNEYGIKGTFNINYGLENNPFTYPYEERIPMSKIKELYKGHEIASHSFTHPTIARCPKEQMAMQILEDRRGLEEVVGYPVRGFAYPNGSFSDDVVDALKSCGMAYARTIRSTHSFDLPTDPFRWDPTCHHTESCLEDLCDGFVDFYKTQYLKCFYVWGHSYEFEKENNWDIIENFSKKIGNKSDIWYATNIEIIDYLDAYNRVQVSVNGDFAYNPNACSIWIEVDKKSIELKSGQITEL